VEGRLQSVEETKLWKLLQWRKFLPTTECNGELWWCFCKRLLILSSNVFAVGTFLQWRELASAYKRLDTRLEKTGHKKISSPSC
jgi:hypothetical protein